MFLPRLLVHLSEFFADDVLPGKFLDRLSISKVCTSVAYNASDPRSVHVYERHGDRLATRPALLATAAGGGV